VTDRWWRSSSLLVAIGLCALVVQSAQAQTSTFGRVTTTMQNQESMPIDLCGTGTGTIVFTITALPAHGTLEDNNTAITVGMLPHVVSGNLTYVPSTGFSGVDTFDFFGADNNGAGIPSSEDTQEVAVQIPGSVFISEVMHSPSGDDRLFEFVEVINPTASPVQITRIDNLIRNSTKDTTSNAVVTIPAGAVHFFATDPADPSLDVTDFLCEWRLDAADVTFVPEAIMEGLFSVSGADCGATDGSRVFLFGAGDVLLDAVDLSIFGSTPPLCVNQSYTLDPSFDPTPNSEDNDDTFNWGCASFVFSGQRVGEVSGDLSSVNFVSDALTPSPTFEPSCFGACCLTDGSCVDGVTAGQCDEQSCFLGGAGRFTQGASCTDPGIPAQCSGLAEADEKCCLPIGGCVEVTVCECVLSGGTPDEGNVCTGMPSDCPASVELAINELEYQQTGTDSTEYLELFGPGNQTLNGFTLTFYNGASSNAYLTVDLSGETIPADGFFVVGSLLVPNVDKAIKSSFGNDTDIIQNEGSQPDGIVLSFDGAGLAMPIIVEALAYGGTGLPGFTVDDGVAAGQLLPNIGLSDTASTTLQKLPDGNSNGWTATFNQTPGSTNVDAGDVGACCNDTTFECSLAFPVDCNSAGLTFLGLGTNCTGDPCIPRGSCCTPDGSCLDDITQAVCEGPGGLGGSWNGDGSVCNDITAFIGCVSGPSAAAAGGCEDWDFDVDTDVDLRDYSVFQQNECVSDPVGACCPPDGVCQDITEFECDALAGEFNAGSNCGSVSCDAPVAGAILINEIWADDPGTDNAEFIELFGAASASLNGLSLIIVDGDTEGQAGTSGPGANLRQVSLQIDFGAADTLGGDGFLAIGFSTDPVVNTLFDRDLDTEFGDGDFSADEIQNGSQTYALTPTNLIAFCSTGVADTPEVGCQGNPNELTPGSIAGITAGAVDTVATLDGTFGDQFYFGGPVVSDGGFAFDYAQRIPNGTDTNSANDWETVFGEELTSPQSPSDPSTPSDTNVSQSSIPGGCCTTSGMTAVCRELTQAQCATSNGAFIGFGSTCIPGICECQTVREARKQPIGANVTLCDVVITNSDVSLVNPNNKIFHVVELGGQNIASTGIAVFGDGVSEIDPILAAAGEGDSIDIAGVMAPFAGLDEIGSPQLLAVNGFAGVPAPLIITAADAQDNSPTAEGLENKLVTLECVEFVEAGGTFSQGTIFNLTPDSGTTTVAVRIQQTGQDLVGQPIPSGLVTMTAIFAQFDNFGGNPTGGYQLLPRTLSDIDETPTCP